MSFTIKISSILYTFFSLAPVYVTVLSLVKEYVTVSVYNTYTQANNILDVGSDDKVYFINEMEDETYELFFGDGVLGRKLENGEVVEISYVVTNGPETNGAKSFNFNGILF